MLQGKTAVITGAGRGIGRGMALLFAKNGADIVLNYRSNVAAVEQTAQEIRELGRQVVTVQADVSVFEQAKELIDAAVKEFGRIDILVNNAGVTKDNLLLRMTEQEFDQVLDVNLKGAFCCTRHAVKYMLKQRGGRIVNISSVVGLSGNAGQCNYASSKAGLVGFTKSAAKELAAKGITVNAVAPGFIRTDMTEVLSDQVKAEYEKQIPMGRLGDANEVAQAALFLASDAASYITGQVVSVNGGLYM